MDRKPDRCQPHYCAFDCPACPEQCESSCKKIKPNCVSVTGQEAFINSPKPVMIMDQKPDKCSPHYCTFDSPACPEQCENFCKKIEPNCVSVTGQEASISSPKPAIIMDKKPDRCQPHYCAFDSPTCPEQCECSCKKIKPNCASVTDQEAFIGSPKPSIIMDRKPDRCHPHYCAFDSPACPEQCESSCKKTKPNCVSVTAQEALNIPELKVPRTKTGIPIVGISTRERIFGIPYDPRKDFDIPLPKEDFELYMKENYDSLHDKALKEYLQKKCCESDCKCPMGPYCVCKSFDHTYRKNYKE